MAKKKKVEEEEVQIVIMGVMPSGETIQIVSLEQSVLLPKSEALDISKHILEGLAEQKAIGVSFMVDDPEVEQISIFISPNIISLTVGIMKV